MNTQIKGALCAGLLGVLSWPTAQAATQDPVKSAFERAALLPAVTLMDLGYAGLPGTDGVFVPSPLTLDGAFSGDGTAIGDGNDANGKSDTNLRVFKSIGGYWLAGYHNDGSGGTYYGFVVSISDTGSINTGFADEGRLKVALPFYPVDVANVANTNKFYFTGPYRGSPTSDYDFGVYCIDGSTSAPCTGFGNSGTGLAVIPVDHNGFHNDFPVKIVATGERLYIAGTSDSAGGLADLDISLAAIDTTLGSPLAGFGNDPDNPGTRVYPLNFRANGVDRSIDLLARTGTALPGGQRVYIVGEAQRSGTNDTDGVVLAVNSETGALDTTFNSSGVRTVYADVGTTNREDELDALAFTRDGDIVLAGTSRDDDGYQELLLAKLHVDGTLDTSFCGGGSCAGLRTLSGYEVPIGIAERTATRDLVVGLTLHADFAGDGHPIQGVMQFGRSGNALHGLQVIDVSGINDTHPGTDARSLLVDLNKRVLIAGTRTFDAGANDLDMVLTRMVDTDTIFANQFETVF